MDSLSFSPEDLYVFFEAVRGFGGITAVAEANHFLLIRDLMNLPLSAADYASEMLDNYEKLCAPCEQLLVKAVEQSYHRVKLYSSTHEWLTARVELNNDVETSTIDETYTSQEALERKEQQDFLSQPEATRAAIRARMKINELEQAELLHFLFSGNESLMVQVDIRNHILRMWYRKVEARLHIHTALIDIPARFHELGCRVFSFLECTGAINFGAVPVSSSLSKFRSKIPNRKEKVAIIGAGISGLIAARQLHSFGLDVTVFEARDRPGGRILTEKSKFSVDVDMGAMLVTGIVQNPLAILAHQTGSRMHFLDCECPLYDIDGSSVPKEADLWAEKEYNAILDATARYRRKNGSQTKAEKMSLGEAFQKCLLKRVERRKSRMKAQRRKMKAQQYLEGDESRSGEDSSPAPESPVKGSSPRRQKNGQENGIEDGYRINPSRNCERGKGGSKNRSSVRRSTPGSPKKSANEPKDERLISRLLRWHIANLEYACAADIAKVSLVHWDQDDPYAFQGEHVLLKKGYEPILEGLVTGIDELIQYRQEVRAVQYSKQWDHVAITTLTPDGSTKVFKFDAVLVTVPLAVLKDGQLTFHPPLPAPKRRAIANLGTGGLMKVAMEFSHRFWVQKDHFGCLQESVAKRGEFYLFWNLSLCTGKPILVGVVAEPSVSAMEERSDDEVVGEAMKVLRRIYPNCPDPIASAISRWSQDPFSRGAYTNIPVGSSGVDYDVLAEPVERVFFGGEHTCRMNPTTCASGVISGLREACRILEKVGAIPSIANSQFSILKQSLKARGSAVDLQDASPRKRARTHVSQSNNTGRNPSVQCL